MRLGSFARSMRSSRAAAAALALALVAACTTDYQENKDNPPYAGANVLAGKRQPGPSSNVESDTSKGPACGTPIPGDAACTVTFKTDILPGMAICATTSCHGGANPAYQPPINLEDPDATWNELASFKHTNGTPYINPCSTVPADSALLCNVNKNGTCGVLMPPNQGQGEDFIAKLNTWATCGSPNN